MSLAMELAVSQLSDGEPLKSPLHLPWNNNHHDFREQCYQKDRRSKGQHSKPERSSSDWDTCPAAERKPRKISGTWAFTGTRVPVYALFENLEGGATVMEFLVWFPEVQEWQVTAVLKHEADYFTKSSL